MNIYIYIYILYDLKLDFTVVLKINTESRSCSLFILFCSSLKQILFSIEGGRLVNLHIQAFLIFICYDATS